MFVFKYYLRKFGVYKKSIEQYINKIFCISICEYEIIEENVSALANFFGTKDSAPAAKLIIDLFTSMIPE